MNQPIDVITQYLGADIAAKMVVAFGGTVITIARNKRPKWLADVVGELAAQRLCEIFDGEQIYVPMMRKALIAERNRMIIADINSGMIARLVAVKYGVSQRCVVQILKKHRNQHQQSIHHTAGDYIHV